MSRSCAIVNGLGGQGEADVGVGQLGAQPVAARFRDRPVVERGRRQVLDRMPGGVRRDARVHVGGHEGQVGRGQGAAPRVPPRIAAGLQLLQVRDVGEVHLGGQVPAQRGPETLVGAERAAGQSPAPVERRRAPAPEQDVQLLVADLEDHGQRLVGEPRHVAAQPPSPRSRLAAAPHSWSPSALRSWSPSAPCLPRSHGTEPSRSRLSGFRLRGEKVLYSESKTSAGDWGRT